MTLCGKVAIVTGGGGNIGRQIALVLARERAQLLVADVSKTMGLSVTQAINEAGGKAVFVQTDITNVCQVQTMICKAISTFGGLDILVCTAGITSQIPFWELSPAQWQKTIEINLTGTYLCIKTALPYLLERGSGRIIIISSASAFSGSGGGVHYAASKGGLIGLTRALARELGSKGILVNAVAPRTIESDMLDKLYPNEELRRKLIAEIPIQRLGKPKEIAELVAFLASENASYINGQVILVDGGRTVLGW